MIKNLEAENHRSVNTQLPPTDYGVYIYSEILLVHGNLT